MSSENATLDMEKFTGWTREHAELERVVVNYKEYLRIDLSIVEAKDLLNGPDMSGMARSEILEGEEKQRCLEGQHHHAIGGCAFGKKQQFMARALLTKIEQTMAAEGNGRRVGKF